MLLNLQSLDIDIRDDEADQDADAHETNPHLDIHPPAECASCNHQSTDQTDRVEQDGKVPGDAVDDDPAVPDKGRELHDCEEGGRKDAG